VGLQLAVATLQVQRLLALQQVREKRTYAAAGHTWDSYCRQVLDRSSNAVETDLANLDHLGQELLTAATLAGLKGTHLKALRSVPADELPRLLPSGAVQLGDRVVPVDADHRDELMSLFSEVLHAERADRRAAEAAREKEAADRQKLSDQLAKLSERVSEGEGDNERLREQIDTLRLLLGHTSDAGAKIDPYTRRFVMLAFQLDQLAEDISRARPDREMIRHAAQPLYVGLSAITRYAGGTDEPAPTPFTDRGAIYEAALDNLADDEQE
jgi:hypothetical protein